MKTLPPGCWLGFGAYEPKDRVLAVAVEWFEMPLHQLEWKWTAGAWLVRVKEEEHGKDTDGG